MAIPVVALVMVTEILEILETVVETLTVLAQVPETMVKITAKEMINSTVEMVTVVKTNKDLNH